MCVDVTLEDGTLDRLLNDNARFSNVKLKVIYHSNVPHPCLFALRNINKDKEIRYLYGKGNSDMYPWQKKRCQQKKPSNNYQCHNVLTDDATKVTTLASIQASVLVDVLLA